MSNDMAIRAAAALPAGYVAMGTVKCPTCRTVFKIIHDAEFKDQTRADDQVAQMRETLSGDHVDSKFRYHLYEYQLD